jgi:Zn-dependent protease
MDEAATFPDEAQERAYHGARELIANPPRVTAKFRTLVITFAFFSILSFSQGSSSLLELGLVVAVLIVHELGHALGMVLFGYKDVRIFFIPLFGAAASGKKQGAAKWKQAIVLLLGPLPGLAAGTVLLFSGASGIWFTLAIQLVIINGFNLLPLAPLDGAQLFRLLIFSRHRYLELAFLVLASAAMLAVGLYLKLWISAIVGGFMLLSLPRRKSLLDAAARLRKLDLPQDPKVLDDAQRRAVFSEMWSFLPAQWRDKHAVQAATIEQLVDEATSKPAGIGVSLALVIGWAAGVALAVVSVLALVSGRPASWQRYEDARHQFAIELPAKPLEEPMERAGQFVMNARLGRDAEFAVIWFPMSRPDWEDLLRAEYSTKRGKQVGEYVMSDGSSAQIVETMGERMWILYRSSDTTIFMVLAKGREADCERVIRSFKLLKR